MTLRGDGAKLTAALRRVVLGSRPKDDPDFEAALDSALTREQERERRLWKLQNRLDVIKRR